MKRLRWAEFIEVLVPTRDRNGRALSSRRQREWKERLARYLLKTLKVTGFQESMREGVWKQEQKDLREYDPKTDRLHLVTEKVHVMRTSCTRAQVDAFRKGGEALLAEMGRALNQEAVVYETREGLTILSL
jgi:predicted secreted protein